MRIWFGSVPFLSMTTKHRLLLNVLSGSVVEPAFIEYLAQEIRDSDDYLEGIPAAKSLYEKCQSATYPQLLATVERLER